MLETAGTTIDASQIIERQKLTWFLVRLVLLSWAITFFDGYDMNVISFAAGSIAKEFSLSRIEMGNLFSIGLLGTMIGGFLFGYIGDRIGRRPAVILATAGFGFTTLLFALSASYTQLLAIRMLLGVFAGGMLPLSWALNIEYAPKRFRATIVTLVMVGYSLGTSLGGPIAIWLIPRYGWQAVFVFGGVLSLVAALALIAWLPESIRFLAARHMKPELIGRNLARLAPDFVAPSDARYVLSDEPGRDTSFRPSLLFAGRLKIITPLLWVAYIFSSATAFFLATWTPLVFEALHFSREMAATAGSINAVMGALGGIALMRFTDTRGPIAICFMPLVAIPALLAGGLLDFEPVWFMVLISLIGFTLIGGHFGMHSIAGAFYPSAYRGNGAGWATSVAKIGSIGGPFVGGLLLSSSLPVRNIFAVLAVCPAMVLICVFIIGRMRRGAL